MSTFNVFLSLKYFMFDLHLNVNLCYARNSQCSVAVVKIMLCCRLGSQKGSDCMCNTVRMQMSCLHSDKTPLAFGKKVYYFPVSRKGELNSCASPHCQAS